jgi:hypothetical protein
MPWSPLPTAFWLLACLPIAGAAAGTLAAEPPPDLEPLPPMIAFPDLDENEVERDATRQLIRKEMGRTYASLGNVDGGRRLLVHRFGLICVPELVAALGDPRTNATVRWNAALTAVALRDIYGPAVELAPLLKPLQQLLSIRKQDFTTPAFAALAAGCFHWPQARLTERDERLLDDYRAVPGPARAREQTATALQAMGKLLVRLSAERKQDFLQVAALLALAKRGGAEARGAFADGSVPAFTGVQTRRARMLASAFLEVEDPDEVFAALHDEERRVRAAAALAIAVALLTETPAAWTAEPAAILDHLTGTHIKMDKEDGAEAVFARGVCAIRRQTNEQWEELWDIAKTASSERSVAEAAAQALLFCEDVWFENATARWARSPQVVLKDPVLALVLLRAGMQGTQQAIEACEAWLKSRAKRPVPTPEWDPRWYAAIGLLRALHRGHVKVRERRERIVKALERAVDKVLDRDAPVREVLRSVIEAHGRRIVEADESDLYLLPASALRRVEESVDCPHALLARDAVDACVHRVNDMIQLLFGLDSLVWGTPDKPNIQKQPQKYLKRFLDEHPYVSRLEFRDDRGLRAAPGLAPGAKGIDR